MVIRVVLNGCPPSTMFTTQFREGSGRDDVGGDFVDWTARSLQRISKVIPNFLRELHLVIDIGSIVLPHPVRLDKHKPLSAVRLPMPEDEVGVETEASFCGTRTL